MHIRRVLRKRWWFRTLDDLLWSPSSSQDQHLLAFAEKLLYFVDSYVLCILTIRKSYWMNWDPHLSYLTLGNSQIAWILQAVLGLFMLSIQPLIMCRQNLLVSLLLTRKLNRNWLEKLPFLCHWPQKMSVLISFLFCTHLTGNYFSGEGTTRHICTGS